MGQYLWGTLKDHIVMDNFLRTQLQHHPEVDPYIMLYMFEHRSPWVEVLELKQNVEAQAKT